MTPGSVFYFRDVSQNHHPYRQLTVSMIESGEAPLWNPQRGAGQPLLANPNALVMHPTTLLFLALPFEAAFKLAIVGQIFLAAMGVWLVLRDIGASRGGSLLGAAVCGFSGFMVSLGNLINLLDSAAFMPLTLWLAGRAVTRGFAPWGSLAALSLAVQVMAGEPAILLCTAAAFLGLHWSFARAGDAVTPPRALKTRVAILAGVVALALALAMVAVLPATELLARSERGAGFDRDEALKWSLPAVALIETAVPHLFGDPTSTDVAKYRGGGVFDAGLPFILSLYLGPGALLLAGLGLAAGFRSRGPRRAEAMALIALAAGGTALALGRFLPLYPALLSLLKPLESVRYPVKYFLIATWAVSLLSARGYDSIANRPGPAGRSALLFRLLIGAGSAGAVLGIAATLILQPQGAAGLTVSILRGAAIVAAAIGLAGISPGRAARLGLLAIPLVDLLAAGVRLNPVAPASFYHEPPLAGRLLDQAGGTGRIWSMPRPGGFAFRTPVAGNADSLVWGFRWDRMTLRNATYFPEGLRFSYDRGNERLDVMPGAAIGRALADGDGSSMRPDARSRLLSLAGVDRAITYGGLEAPGFTEAARLEGQSNIPVVVMKNDAAVPRVRVVARAEVIPEMGAALRRLDDPSFDPARMVILEQPMEPPMLLEPTTAVASARIVAETPNRVLVGVSSSARGILVLADTFYPGWQAKVDGADAPIIRADAMFRAVAIPAGAHEIEFSYRPSSVRSGLMVTAASLLLAALLAVPRRR